MYDCVGFEKVVNNMEKQIDFNGEWSNEYDDTAHKIIPAYHSIYELTQHLLRDRLNKEARILVAGAGRGKEIIPTGLLPVLIQQSRCFLLPEKKWRLLLWRTKYPLSWA
jgi:hypothetical protein